MTGAPRPAAGALERGRELYAERSWADAYESLARADEVAALAADDLELLSTCAFMLGREAESLAVLERAYHAYLGAGEPLRAVRCAFWIGTNLAARGELGRATGWLGQAHRLLDGEPEDSVERGYLLIPEKFRHEAAGDLAAAAAAAGAAAEIGRRSGDPNLFALAALGQGQTLIREGQIAAGLALMDEAMVVVIAGGLSPIVSGLVYCGVILTCQEVFELRRAQEWTLALTRWCDEQSGLVAFTGRCLIHRAEVMQVHGSWDQALDEARRAGARLRETMNRAAAGLAFYRQGELHRLRGEFDAAEQAYRAASGFGREPQPGMALLRLAEGRDDAAVAAIRRASGETTEMLGRAALLPAYVEIALAAGEIDEAGSACRELEELAGALGSGMLGAMAAFARGTVELANDAPQDALVALRRAWQAWQELDAPYEVARVRVVTGLACRALGDEDAAELELAAAREAFEELDAAPDLARLEALTGRSVPADTYGLTRRELEVLRLIAGGRSNRAIAAELVISEHTVARHVQNIFAKLRLSSRSAATAFAFEHDLV